VKSDRGISLWWLPLVALATVHAQDKPVEAPAPAPSAPIQLLVDEANAVSSAGDAAKALGIGDRALALAQQSADMPGEAQAHRTRAAQFVKLARNSEAQAAWRDAEAAWKRIADGPGQVEALGWQAVFAIRGNAQQGAELLERALGLARAETRRPLAAATSLVEVGRALTDRSLLREARQTLEAAMAMTERVAPGSLELASTLLGLGNVAFSQGDRTAARDLYQRSLEIREKLAPNSLAVAGSLHSLGTVASVQGDPSGARDFFQRSLAIREKLAPNSLAVATSLLNLGNLASDQGDLNVARDFFQRSLEINEKLAPDSLAVALSLHNLGGVAYSQGDLRVAREYRQRSLAINEKLAPNSQAVALSLNSLGNVAYSQGDLSAARDFFQRGLAINEKVAPNSPAVAMSLSSLGNVAGGQGDLSAARDYHQRALTITERLAPNSIPLAQSLHNLGSVFLLQGDLNTARDFFQRALALSEKLAPNTLAVAFTLPNLGRIAAFQGDLNAALDFHQRALTIREKLAPNSLGVADSLHNLGEVRYSQNDLNAARDYYERALAIRGRLGPNSLELADSFRWLARIAHDQGDLTSAVQATARAWAIVRSQAAAIVGDEARQAFGSQFKRIGSQMVQYQLALGKSDDAFVSLEEGRAQALLHILAERGIAKRLAPADVWHQYELAQAASDRAGKALENAGAAEAKARVALESEIARKSAAAVIEEKRRVLVASEQATEQARQDSVAPRVEAERRWADVRHTIEAAIPAPTSTMDARRALPHDTVLAAFVVGDEATTLFLVRRDGPVQTFALAMPVKELTTRVESARRAVSGETDGRGLKLAEALKSAESEKLRVAAARELYQKLFPPAARQEIAKAIRVLLSPDGILWDLPFAALVMNDQGTPRYLGLEKPLAYSQSLTTFAQTIQAPVPPRSSKPSVLVVGNPLFAETAGAGSAAGSSAREQARGELALLSRDGAVPAPLPYAEAEAQQVATLYRGRASRGKEPTETWFRQHAAEADVIHLATHGYFNPFRSVSSGVLLAVPEREPGPGETDNDGALQAWEIFSLHLRADLVVLSACQTGVGSKVPGEGLVGLTRAFQAAGAASIVATQWNVADKSTATGMVALHQSLLKGLAKDEALRQAMRKLANDPATAHPRYWAPFVLVGDLRPLRTSAAR
jgi:CHAT domain-containing protein/tetratricopeptide (TPR) repeat protein